MNGAWASLQSIVLTIGDVLSWFLGGVDAILLTLIAFIIVSFIIGLLYTLMGKKLSTRRVLKTIVRKTVIFLLVGIGHLTGMYLLGGDLVLRSAIIIFYISTEGISILQDASNMGLPIPQSLKKALTYLNAQSEKRHNHASEIGDE